MTYNRNKFPSAVTEDNRLVTSHFLIKLSVVKSRELYLRKTLTFLKKFEVNDTIVTEVASIDVEKMDQKATENDRTVCRSINVNTEHDPIYNLCFESIRVGFTVSTFVETLKSL
jgi:hypothetical protein